MCCNHLQRKTGIFNSILKASLAASVFVSAAHAQPVVHDMEVVDATSFGAFKSAITKSAYVTTEYMLDPNPRVVASITATMVFVSNNPLATSQEINDFLITYSNALAGFDGGDPDLQRSSNFFAAIRGMDQGSASFVHSGLDLRVGHRVLEALDIEVPAPLDFVTTQSRMVKFENARLRSFKSSPDWSIVLTLALYGQDLDGNANDSISTIVENYLVSEGFHPVPADTSVSPYWLTRDGLLGLSGMSYAQFVSEQNSVDPINISGSVWQQNIQTGFQDLQINANSLITQIAQGMVNPPTVIEAAQNTTDSNFLQQQIDIYHEDLNADILAQSSIGWNSMMLLQNQHNEAQQYSTAARDFAHVRLQTDDTLAKTKLGIQIVSGSAQVGAAFASNPAEAIGPATDVLLASLDLADAFGAFNSPPPPEEQIFDQIVEVRQDIDDMRVQMHDRFDRIEESLNLIYINMNQNFNLIGNSIGDLQASVDDIDRDIAVNHAALERIETALYGMFQDTMWLDLAQKVDLVLNYRNAFGVDLPYNGSTSYINSESALMSWTVTAAANTVYAGPTTSLLQSFNDAQGVLNGSSIGRNVNDLRVFPQTLGLPMLFNSRVVASAPWTQGASVYAQLAHESPWYFAYMYDNQTNSPGAADLDSIIAKGDNLVNMMDNGRSSALFNALLNGYDQTINVLSTRESQIGDSVFPGFDPFGGLTQPTVQQSLPRVPRLSRQGGDLPLPNTSDNWNIFLVSQSPSEKDIAPISYALVNEAASDFGVSPTVSYTWNAVVVETTDVFMFFTFTVDGNGGVPSRGLHAQTTRELHLRVYDNNGNNIHHFGTNTLAMDFFSDNIGLWNNLVTHLISDVDQGGQSYSLLGGPFGGLTLIEIVDDGSLFSPLNNGRAKSLELMEALQVEVWNLAKVDNTIISFSDQLIDWATLLEAYATLSMPDLLAESAVAASALHGFADTDSFALAVDVPSFYANNANNPGNAMFISDRLQSNIDATRDTINIWLAMPFPGHGYINYMLTELYDLRDFAYKLAIDDRYVGSGNLVVAPENGLLANDIDQQFRTIEVDSFTQPDIGNVVVNPDGSFEYTNDTTHGGITSFTYTSKAQITDAGGQPQYFVSDPATVVIAVDSISPTFIAVPAECPTIAIAIDLIRDDPSSVIELAPGVYHELINTQGKAFTLRSASGNAEDTHISGFGLTDPDGYGRVVTINSGEGRDTVIQDITIRDGKGFITYPFAGAGILITDAEPTIRNCIFSNNIAFRLGGGIAISGTRTPLIVNCLFYDNFSRAGGAIGTFEYAGSAVTGAGDAIIVNCTFHGNIDNNGDGGAISFDALSTNSVVSNSVLWGNTPGQIVGSGVEVRYSLIQDGLPAGVIDGGGNINADPLLVNPNPNGGGDFRLSAGSPAIDAANNTQPELAGILTDLGGDPRFIDDLSIDDTGVGPAPVIDMGAYEFQSTTTQCAVDFNNDGTLNFFDVSIFLQLFAANDPSADMNSDNRWNFFDVSAFLQAFGAGCP